MDFAYPISDTKSIHLSKFRWVTCVKCQLLVGSYLLVIFTTLDLLYIACVLVVFGQILFSIRDLGVMARMDDLIVLSWHALQVGKCQILIVLNLVGYKCVVVNVITESHEHVVFYGNR